jgi:hypothetical protein
MVTQAPTDAGPVTQNAPIANVEENAQKPWTLWALLVGFAVVAGMFFAWTKRPKVRPSNTQSDDHRPKQRIISRGVFDDAAISTLAFSDGKDVLPAILTGPGEVTTDLVFDDAALA